MQTSELLLRQVRRALAAAFLLGGVAAMLQFAIPLFSLYAIDSAIPARSGESIVLLAVLAAAALATQSCLNAVRTRILLRAGLWAEHTLGSELLRPSQSAGELPVDKAGDIAALARLRRSTTDGSLLAGLDAPWQVLMIGGIALIDWRLGAIAGIATLLILAHGWASLGDVDTADAATADAQNRTQAFSRALARPASDKPAGNGASLSDRWERINGEYVANAYALAAKAVAAADFSRFVHAAAQVAAMALGAQLAIEGSLSIGALVAALLLMWAVLAPMDKLTEALPSLAPARSAWLRLGAVQRTAGDRPAATSLPLLRISGPLAAGFAAVLALVVLGAAMLVHTPLGEIVGLNGRFLSGTPLTRVVSQRSGTSAQVFVKPGTLVARGDLIATLDTRELAGRLATLKLQAATSNIELGGLRQEQTAMAASVAAAKNRAALEKLDARVAEVGRRSRDLIVEIAVAEEEIAGSRILAPVSGRVASLSLRAGMPVETDTTLATLEPADATWLSRMLADLDVAAWPGKIADFFGVGTAHARGASGP